MEGLIGVELISTMLSNLSSFVYVRASWRQMSSPNSIVSDSYCIASVKIA